MGFSSEQAVTALKSAVFEKKWPVFLCFWAISMAVYAPAAHAGFVTDWLGWEARYREMGWGGIPNCFGYRGLLHIGQAVFFTLFWLFGRDGWAWLAVSTGLHAAVAWLGWRLFADLFEKTARPLSAAESLTLLGGAALFLVSPYAAEAIVWRVCLHYLLMSALLLAGLRFALSFLEKNSSRDLLLAHACFFTALFTLEISLVFPLMIGLLVVGYALSTGQRGRLGGWLLRLVGPGAAGWGLFFLLNKIFLGAPVGHYGAAEHLRLRPMEMAAFALKTLLKDAAFLRYFEHPIKEKWFALLDQPAVRWTAVALLGAFFLLAALSFFGKKEPRRPRFFGWSGVALGWFLLSVAPASNLFFYWIGWSENDRYGYFPLAFWWMAVASIGLFLQKTVRIGLFLAICSTSLLFLGKTVAAWRVNHEIQSSLIKDFRWWDARRVVVLGVMENYRGTYGFRLFGGPSGFREALEQATGRRFSGEMLDVCQFNMERPTDGLRVQRDSTGRRVVQFNQYGNWWWADGVWKFNLENPVYSAKLGEWADFTLVEKEPRDTSTVFIFQNGLHWEESR